MSHRSGVQVGSIASYTILADSRPPMTGTSRGLLHPEPPFGFGRFGYNASEVGELRYLPKVGQGNLERVCAVPVFSPVTSRGSAYFIYAPAIPRR